MDVLMAAEAAGSVGDGSSYWHLALILAAIGFLGIFARWRKRRAPQLPTAREMRERDHEPDRYRDAADKAIVELLETSRSLNAQVDTKIRMLNRLVKEAETAAAHLEKILAETRGQEVPPAEQPKTGENGASRESGRKPAPARTFVSELQERVYRLKEEGRNVAEIAKATNLSTTEVRFAIDGMGTAERE